MGQTSDEKQYLIEKVGEREYETHFQDELPQHQVCVDGFWMGKFEVTQKAFQAYIESAHSENPMTTTCHKVLKDNTNENNPAACVHWNQAKEFTEWLKQQNNEKYTFRLPTEAEWEYAARAGSQSMRYWGDASITACEYANVGDQSTKQAYPVAHAFHECTDGYGNIAPVGQFLPNDFGLHDMLGNVWEWCEDNYNEAFYLQEVTDNPMNQTDSKNYSLRGGGWYSAPVYVRSGMRDGSPADDVRGNAGFRVVRDLAIRPYFDDWKNDLKERDKPPGSY